MMHIVKDEESKQLSFFSEEEDLTAEQILERLVVAGVSKREIAALLGVSEFQLRKHEKIFRTALPKTIAKVSHRLIESALAGDVRAAIFFLRSRAKWGEPTESETTESVVSVLKVPAVNTKHVWKEANDCR